MLDGVERLRITYEEKTGGFQNIVEGIDNALDGGMIKVDENIFT